MTILHRKHFVVVIFILFVLSCAVPASIKPMMMQGFSRPSASSLKKIKTRQAKKKGRSQSLVQGRQQARRQLKKETAALGLPYRQFDDDKNREEEKRGSITGQGLRQDKPAEAAEAFKEKRLPVGAEEFSSNQYLIAREQIQKMPRYSLASGQFSQPSGAANFSTEALPSAWTWLGPGNIGGRTRALVIHPTTPDTMYAAGVSGGIWKTINAGAQWAPIADLLANINVCVLALDPANPNIIYAGTGEYSGGFRGAGIFKTTDGGVTWTRLNATNTSDFYYVLDIVVSPNNSQRIYASTDKGVFRSLDGGTTWTRTFSSGNQNGVIGLPYDLAIRTDKPTDDIVMAFYEALPVTQGQFYRNPDAGGTGTWTATFSEAGLSRAALAIAPTNQNVIYAIGVSNASGHPYYNALHAFYKSIDGGQTWTAQVRNTDPTSINTSLISYVGSTCDPNYGFSGQGFYNLSIGVDPADENRVWVGAITWFRSDDGGKNWGVAALGRSSYVHPDNHNIAFHPNYNGTTNQTVFVANDGGIYRTDNARAATTTDNTALCAGTNPSISWRPINNNYGVTQFHPGAVYPDGKTYFGGTQDNGTERGSDASGANGWNYIYGGDGGFSAVDPTNTNVLYVENTRLSLKKSTDGGSNFVSAINGISGDTGFRFTTPFTMDSSDPQRLWMGGTYMWRTADAAANWALTSQAMSGNVSAIAVASNDSNYVAAGTGTGYFYRTTAGMTANSTTVWANSQPRSGYLSWLAFDPSNKNTIYATYTTFGGKHVWKTTDLGATWTNIDGAGSTGLPDIPVNCIVIDPMNSQRLFIGTDMGVFVSLDGGATWASENTGFVNVVVTSLVVNTVNGVSTLYAFTYGRGVWRVDIGSGCTYSFSTKGRYIDLNGGSGSVTVTPSPTTGCAWTATSNTPWITVDNFNSSTVNYSVAANNDGITRIGTIAIAGKTYYVTQGCSTLSTTSVNVPASGGAASVNVIVPAGGCAWTATSNVPWIQVTSGSSGSTSGTVGLNVNVTNSTSPRTGTLTIAGQTVTVTQAGGILDLEITRAHTGNLAPDVYSSYTMTVKNVGTAATNGVMQLADSITSGTLVSSATGTNWTFRGTVGGVLVMERTAALNPGESTTVTISVRPSILAIPSITYKGSISISGDSNTANNAANDTFVVANPVPVLTAITPTTAVAGSGAFTLTIDGSMFAPNSKVQWNGVDRPTVYYNIIRLTAQISAADIANIGTAKITVVSPTPGGGTSTVKSFASNTPAPTLTSISPTSVAPGGATFNLTVNGSGFFSNSVVRINGVDRATTYVNGSQLTAQILAADIASSGTPSITVFTPTPGGGTSAAQTLNIAIPAPTLTSISPNTVIKGGAAFTLTANGTNFSANSVIVVKGVSYATTFVSSTKLTAQISAADIASVGILSVLVMTPAPNGGTSTAQSLTINNPAPTLTSILPASAVVGSAAFTLNVTGTNFTNNSVVRWNGTDRATTFVSGTQLSAQIVAADTASIGTPLVTVFTPTPGGGTSTAQTFTVGYAAPTLTALSPTSALAGGSLFALNVQGTNFINGSVIRWNGAARPTTFVNNTILTAAIPASDIANIGIASITVFTPTPGGGLSSALSFPVNFPSPTLTSINPTSMIIGSADFTLTLNGSGFTSSSVVRWNGVARLTTFVNSSQITTLIRATEMISSGTAKVSVLTPTPGGGTSAEQLFTLTPRPITTVSAASYTPTILGKDAIASAFGLEMATTSALATALPLPTTLGGTTVKVKDSSGVERPAPLFYISPSQVNFQVPVGTALGSATITITSGDGKITTGSLQIAATAPGLFSADSNGSGLAAANIQRVAGDGKQTFENVAVYDPAVSKMVAIPIDFGPVTDQVFLVLYGTGVRYNSGLSNVKASVGGVDAQVLYAGQHCCYVGVDQLNILLPRSLAARGEVEVILTVDGKIANPVKLFMK